MCIDNIPTARTIGAKLTNKTLDWESKASDVKRNRTRWATKKKAIEDKLSFDENVQKVLAWIRKDDDPELPLESIRKTVTSEGRYEEAAQWFLDRDEFATWNTTSQTLPEKQKPKRVLWVKGPYGTGKTTIL